MPDLPIEFDREQAFLIFATFCGDIEKTAHALGIRPEVLLRVVDEEGWNKRVGVLIELRKSQRPGDFERAVNRALNFVQAHKFRMFIERVVFRITALTPDEFEEYLLTEHGGKDGTYKRLTTRALADLASAMEKAHSLSYMALNDTAQERVRRKDDDDGGTSAADLHLKLAKAMQDAKSSDTIRAKLFDAQLSTAQALAVKPPPSPLDNDNH